MLGINHFSDQKLIDLLHSEGRKESKAIEYLLRKNRKKITAYILRNSGDKSDAAVVLSEGITHLVFNIRKGKFRGESSIATYLFSICRGVWLKELKKRSRYVNNGDEKVGEEMVEELTPFHHFNEEQLKEEVQLLLERLGNACKTVLELWAQHFSMVEISNQMGYKNAQIAMNKKNRCLTKLKGFALENATYRESLKSYLG